MDAIQAFYQAFEAHPLPRYRQLPTVELYKDQVVEMISRYLQPFYPQEGAITSTMVNNYVKLKVIPAPVKKRYSRNQLAELIQICLLKKVLSIAEIRRLLQLQRETGSAEDAYDSFCTRLEQVARLICMGETDRALSESTGSLIDSAVYAFAYKIHFEVSLATLTGQKENEAAEE